MLYLVLKYFQYQVTTAGRVYEYSIRSLRVFARTRTPEFLAQKNFSISQNAL